METRLEYILTNSYKDEMISYITSHPGDFDELINLAISNKQPYSWRAAWLLWSCMEKNDRRITKYVKEIIDVLHLRNDNQLRELLMILQRMDLNEKHEGALFDICVNIWKEIGKKPSIRHKAFQHIAKIAKKYPELSNEVIFLTQTRYLAPLSEGVKKSIYKMIDKL